MIENLNVKRKVKKFIGNTDHDNFLTMEKERIY